MTTDVRLRPVRDDDLPILFAHQLDPESTAMAGFPSRDEAAFRAHWTRIRADATVVIAVAEVDGAVAGNLVSWVDDGRRCIGYWFGRDFWGRGVATQALRAFAAAVEDRPLFAHVAIHNAGSTRVLEKCGFTLVVRGGDELVFELR